MTVVIRAVTLPSQQRLPVIGQGTWYLGEDPVRWDAEIAALRLGLDLGLVMIDTAEMYGDGAAEELIAEAIKGHRDEVVLIDKVMPSNASRWGVIQTCERSLRRMRTDHMDLYLLHWRGRYPLPETIEAFTELVTAGKILQWGVSNFDLPDMEELMSIGGDACATNQILYNLTRRGVEYDLLPWCRERGIPVLAYSPIGQGSLLDHPPVIEVASRHGVSPAQVALAWVVRQEGVAAIPRSGDSAHVRQNAAALDLNLTEQDLAELDLAFPPPSARQPLEMI